MSNTGPNDFIDLMVEVEQEDARRNATSRFEQRRAESTGRTAAALGTSAEEMTPGQQDFANAYNRRRGGVTGGSKPGRFVIDATGRKPEKS